ECIIAHPDDARSGVSRPQIKKFVETKYNVEFNTAAISQLSRAITRGAGKEVFLLPKGPSGRVKLTPKARAAETAAAKENKPTPQPKTAVAPKKTVTSKKPATIKTATKSSTAKASSSKPKTAVKAKPASKLAATKKSTQTKKASAAKPKPKASATTKKTTTASKRGSAKKVWFMLLLITSMFTVRCRPSLERQCPLKRRPRKLLPLRRSQ
ncbi:1,4-alpha-glucan branching enzyme GlgB, partial [Leucoagaricus sp. SymC.cos]